MTKDYKNISRKKPEKASPLQTVMPFITGLVIGLFVAFIVYLKEHHAAPDTPSPDLVIKDKTRAAIVTPKTAEDKKIPEPQFDFYQILPNMEVNVSEWEADTEPNPDAAISNDDSGVYILQVGSFEQYEAADEVKARLALLGVNADIQRVVINGREVRHRVRVGPYKDLAKLQEARDRLHANNLDFVLLKLKVDDLNTQQ